MDVLGEQIARIRRKVANHSVQLNPCCPPERIEAFELRHGIALPEAYRRFIGEVGDGGQGPPDYGVLALEEKLREYMADNGYWEQLPHIRCAFPFTKTWIWEDGDLSAEGETSQVGFGSLRLGTHGCGLYFHLIVTGPERGFIWELADVGIRRADSGNDFLTWYEAWLDRRER